MLGHWYGLLLPKKETTKVLSNGVVKHWPRRSDDEIYGFTNFIPVPKFTRNDDDELMLIFMMQGC